MKHPEDKWTKLVAKAQLERPAAQESFDPAWLTRTAAQAMAARAEGTWEVRYAWRALGVAAVVTVVALGSNLRQWTESVEEEAAEIDALPALTVQSDAFDLSLS